MLDFNKANLSEKPVSIAINAAIEAAAEHVEQEPRDYLGASIAGSPCLRQAQYAWQVQPSHPARTRDIFDRGHWAEDLARRRLVAAGFRFAPVTELAFEAAGGLFRGHADGIIEGGPELPGVAFPCLWECKCVNARGWRKLERDGLLLAYPTYAAQLSLYQAYLEVENPALLTAINADTCEDVFTCWCRSTRNAPRIGAIGPSQSSGRPPPASCCPGSPPIPKTGAATSARTGSAAGSRECARAHSRPGRQAVAASGLAE